MPSNWTPMPSSIIRQWEHYGNYYGYPQCCIHSFCYEVTTRSQRKAGKKTGFIPCKHHAKLQTPLRELMTTYASKHPSE